MYWNCIYVQLYTRTSTVTWTKEGALQDTEVCLSDTESVRTQELELHFNCPRTCAISCSNMSDSFASPWTVAHQAPLSMEFSRQEYWSE